MAIPVFVDTFNLAYMTRKKYKEPRTISYEKFFKYLVNMYQKSDDEELDIIAYVRRTENSDQFVCFLQDYCNAHVSQRSIDTIRGENFDVDLAVDVLSNVAPRMVICSASPNLVKLLQVLSEHRTITTVHAVNIPKRYRDYCVATEFGVGAFNMLPRVNNDSPSPVQAVAVSTDGFCDGSGL